jgi:FkbM family methyltransferase
MFRAAGLTFHKTIARSTTLSKIYLRGLGKILKFLPDDRFKLRVLNNAYSVRWPDIALRPQAVTIQGTPLKIIPHFGEFDFYALGMRELKYEENVFSYLKSANKKYDAIIEIGANVGIYTVFFASFYKNCDVYAFEPSPKAFSRLIENLKINRAAANVFNAAVGEKTSFESFYEPSGHLTNGSLSRDFSSVFSSEVEEREVLVVDGALLEGVLSKHENILIKIDVEGAEAGVLKSLARTIENKKPDILVECLKIFESSLNRLNLQEKYSLFEVGPGGLKRRERFVASENRDYFLSPKSCEAPLR